MRPTRLHNNLWRLVYLRLYFLVLMRAPDPGLPEVTEDRMSSRMIPGTAKITRRVNCAIVIYHFSLARILELRLLEICEHALVFDCQHYVSSFDIYKEKGH